MIFTNHGNLLRKSRKTRVMRCENGKSSTRALPCPIRLTRLWSRMHHADQFGTLLASRKTFLISDNSEVLVTGLCKTCARLSVGVDERKKLKKRASSWSLEQARFVQSDRCSQIMVSYPRYHSSDLVWWSLCVQLPGKIVLFYLKPTTPRTCNVFKYTSQISKLFFYQITAQQTTSLHSEPW